MITALGSDFCPNAFSYNMQLTSHYACTNYRLTPSESITAATLNAAYSLNLHERVGSLEEGKAGDMILLDVENWVYAVYSFGDSFIEKVIKNGVVLWLFLSIVINYILGFELRGLSAPFAHYSFAFVFVFSSFSFFGLILLRVRVNESYDFFMLHLVKSQFLLFFIQYQFLSIELVFEFLPLSL